MFCFELEFEDGTLCYIDGHDKYVIKSNNVSKMFYDIITVVKSCLVVTCINIRKDHVVKLSFNKDPKQQKLMINLISKFAQSAGKAIINAAVFDRNHFIMSAINNFSRVQRIFMCTLRPDQYKGLKDFELVDGFKLLKKYEPCTKVNLFESEMRSEDVLEWVTDARYILQNSIQEETLTARVALVVKFMQKRVNIIPIITNLSATTEPDIAKIAKKYFYQKQYQGNIFVDLVKSIEFDERIPSQTIRLTKRPVPKVKEQKEKKGISIRSKMLEEQVIPPYTSVRSMADDIAKKREE